MIAIDTNVVVRFLTRDDERQYAKAFQMIRNAPRIFLSDTVILETEWVLRHAYGFSSKEIHSAMTALFGLENIVLRDARALSAALAWYMAGSDFADALHLALCAHCQELFTFDKAFFRHIGTKSKCPVRLL
ncbi:type II toxin-antitoxin system VapC family toxin [Desulfonatronum sp. SC1]|uniref:type II toxin-antitoxin system VapC family toxin n=1 Tax=Desulfonatronum sp. SC1 TaxID=2109626 RepID=UPI000D305AC0|nr:type II toxin-antitoxin system VapC family toxin [Desulfonatronum sp. SC1]PTN34886.1 PIN domain nuclease [Desulfonatronum sp. SC1]